jgi:sugar phosphate isomerase/epimerase
MMKLSIVSTLRGGFFFPDMLPGGTFQERLSSLKRFGFDAVEIWGMWLKQDFDSVRQALKDEGVPVSNICSGFRGNLLAGDREERMTCFQDFNDLLELSARLEAGGLVFVPLFDRRPQVPDLSPMWNPYETERKLFIDMMGRLTARAETLGTRLLLEPVNRYETHLFNTLEDVAEVIEEVGSDALRMTPDFFHMNIEETDMAESIRKYGHLIGHVHIVDSNRFLPGQGHTDFSPAVDALKQVGYSGHLSLECFARGEPETVLPETVRLLKTLTGDK